MKDMKQKILEAFIRDGILEELAKEAHELNESTSWEYETLEEALEDMEYDEELNESKGNDRHKKFEIGDVIMSKFYSPSSRKQVFPHRILVITSTESERGEYQYRGFALTSHPERSNKKGGYKNSLYIKNYGSIIEKGPKVDKEAIIVVDDLVKFSSRDLSRNGSYKGHVTDEFLEFVYKAYNNYKNGVDNSEMTWEK